MILPKGEFMGGIIGGNSIAFNDPVVDIGCI
jgi:hypothetical protein